MEAPELEGTHRITQCSSWHRPPKIPPWASLGAPGALAASGLCPFLRSLGSAQHPLGEKPFPEIQPKPLLTQLQLFLGSRPCSLQRSELDTAPQMCPRGWAEGQDHSRCDPRAGHRGRVSPALLGMLFPLPPVMELFSDSRAREGHCCLQTHPVFISFAFSIAAVMIWFSAAFSSLYGETIGTN